MLNAPLLNLPMQLMTSMAPWLSSPSACQWSSVGLPLWNPLAIDPQKLNQAVAEEAKNRVESLLKGLLRYGEIPYQRVLKEPPTIWRKGNARLLDYSLATRHSSLAPILFIPSLINRYYILDLDEERSLLRYIAATGACIFVLDWGKPGEYEKHFSCEDYVTKTILQAIDFVQQTSGKKVNLAGYCMGGVMALAASLLKTQSVNSLSLFATPWNFHCNSFSPFLLHRNWHATIDAMLTKQDTLSAQVIQSLFYWTDPWVFEQKFRRFADIDDPKEIHEFMALEHWVNDGVPMTVAAARECLIGWAQKNQLADGSWQVAGKKIDPTKIKCPVFMAMPENDHIVPKDCAEPLAKSIKHAKIIRPHAGHVSMMVGKHAKRDVWQPFARWLQMQ